MEGIKLEDVFSHKEKLFIENALDSKNKGQTNLKAGFFGLRIKDTLCVNVSNELLNYGVDVFVNTILAYFPLSLKSLASTKNCLAKLFEELNSKNRENMCFDWELHDEEGVIYTVDIKI